MARRGMRSAYAGYFGYSYTADAAIKAGNIDPNGPVWRLLPGEY